jgi:hypothetical protein
MPDARVRRLTRANPSFFQRAASAFISVHQRSTVLHQRSSVSISGRLFCISVHQCSSAVGCSASAFISVHQRSAVLHQRSSVFISGRLFCISVHQCPSAVGGFVPLRYNTTEPLRPQESPCKSKETQPETSKSARLPSAPETPSPSKA